MMKRAGYEEPQLQNFGAAVTTLVRMPPTEGETGGQALGSAVTIITKPPTRTRP